MQSMTTHFCALFLRSLFCSRNSNISLVHRSLYRRAPGWTFLKEPHTDMFTCCASRILLTMLAGETVQVHVKEDHEEQSAF